MPESQCPCWLPRAPRATSMVHRRHLWAPFLRCFPWLEMGSRCPLPVSLCLARCFVDSLSGLHGCLLLVTERGPPPESVYKPGDNDHARQPSQAPASLAARTDALSTPLLSEGSPAPLLLEPSFMELPRAFGEQGSYFAHVPSPSECPS